jgi:hypothetical protein
MGQHPGRSAFLSLAITAISLLLIAPLGSAPTRVFEVATDSAVGNNSLGMPGSQDLIKDPFGKYLVVYVDAGGNLSIAYANTDPATPGAWGTPIKSPPPLVSYRRPAAVFTTPITMRILAEGGPAAGDLVDVSVQIHRDLAGNIESLTYGDPAVLATSAQYVSATVAHDGSVIAVWNSAIPGASSTVFALRWTFASGWRSVSNPLSGVPDVVIVDTSDTEAIHPNVIERPDTFALYVMGNRGPRSNLTTLVFNAATFAGASWTWGTQDLAYETNASRGFSDATDLAWDPIRSVVVATYDISRTSIYGVIRIDASGTKVHVDTPSLVMTNNEWGVLQVDPNTGDYYLFTVDTPLAPPWGSEYGAVAYTRCVNGVWSRTLTVIDNETNNMAISPRRPTMLGLSDGGSLEVVYAKGKTAPATIIFVRLSP